MGAYTWEKMDEQRKLEVLAAWIRESTLPEGIASLCETDIGTIDRFVAEKLPTLKNMYNSLKHAPRAHTTARDDYPPFNFRRRL